MLSLLLSRLRAVWISHQRHSFDISRLFCIFPYSSCLAPSPTLPPYAPSLDRPNDEPTIPADGVNLDDGPIRSPLVRLYTGNRVLMDRLELSTRLHGPDPAGRGIRRGTPSVGLSESVEGLALQSTDPGAAESTGARRLRGQAGPTTGRGIVEGLHLLPALLRSLEEHRLAIVSRGDEGLFRRKAERLVRQRVRADDLDCRGRLAGSAGVDDADG